MNRHVMAIAAGIALLVAGIANAAPKATDGATKSDEKVCVRGEGHEFVDKNASLYISPCEVGNAGFFTASYKASKSKMGSAADASCCAVDSKSAKVVKTTTAEVCAPGAACCEIGNAAFFHNATCCGGQHSKMHGTKAKSEKKAKDSASR